MSHGQLHDNDENLRELQHLVSERDLWKSKAEKLVEAIRALIKTESPWSAGYQESKNLIEALAEFNSSTTRSETEKEDWRTKVKDIMDKGSQTL